jgi:hypothetical protein
MRHNTDDIALYYEAREAEDLLERLFSVCDLLWIDDLHDEMTDIPFWMRHIQPYVEQRVKHRMPTIISTTLPPDDESLPKRVIEGLFMTVLCDGYRPEVDAYPWPDAER